jgi:hypothetical protein
LAGAKPELVVAMAYNAGLGAFPQFPRKADSVETAMGQLNLYRGEYAAWSIRSKANKAVEIFDYLQWFPHLANFWNGKSGQPPSPLQVLSCFNSSPQGSSFKIYPQSSAAAAQIRAEFTAIPIRRLSFGHYVNEQALLYRGEWQEVRLDMLEARAHP